jgi:hypothetical protein
VKNQYIRIKNDPILGDLYGKNSTDLGKIDTNGRIFLSKKGFIRWIQTVNMNTVDESLRANFATFQNMIFDFLYGSSELHTAIKHLRNEVSNLKATYSEAGRQIQLKEKELKELLDNIYQYRLPFTGDQKAISHN